MYHTTEKENGTDPRRDPFAWRGRGATADTTRGARPLCAYVGGIGSRALNPNLYLSALKRLSNGTAAVLRCPLRPHESDYVSSIAPISELTFRDDA